MPGQKSSDSKTGVKMGLTRRDSVELASLWSSGLQSQPAIHNAHVGHGIKIQHFLHCNAQPVGAQLLKPHLWIGEFPTSSDSHGGNKGNNSNHFSRAQYTGTNCGKITFLWIGQYKT